MADASGNFIFNCLVGPCPPDTLSGLDDVTVTDAVDTQILRYNGTEWLNDYDDKVFVRVYNADFGVTLEKGKVVYINGSHNPNVVAVGLADASDDDKMPGIGVVYEDIGPRTEGLVVSFGTVNGVDDETGYTWQSTDEGKKLYVSPTNPGEMTVTRPTAETHLIQNIGILMQAHATNSFVKVAGSYRSNDIPNASSVTDASEISYFYVKDGDSKLLKADIQTSVSALTDGQWEHGGVMYWSSNGNSPTIGADGQISFGTAVLTGPGNPAGNTQLIWDDSLQRPKWSPQPQFPSSPAQNTTLVYDGLQYEAQPYYYPSYLTRSNGTVQNLNGTNVAVNLQTLDASAGDDLDWNAANRSRIEIVNDGDYKISFNLYGESTNTRANVIAQLRLNGTTFFGPKTACGYIRNTSGHNESSVHLAPFIYTLSAGDYIEIVCNQAAIAGNWDTTIGTSNITVERLV